MTIRFRHLALLLGAVASLSALNAQAAEADLSVADAYVRLAPPGTPTTGAFMTIKNAGGADRKLLKADSPVARSVELHNHINDNGVMKMRQVAEIDVKAKGQAVLKPGSYHIMLIDLKAPLKEGETVPLTLTFDDGSTKQLDAPIKKPQAMMQMDHKH
ncbi:MAG: hypothetical protein BGO63_10570 [Candidatus Accumulibacter sp. 66-26]|nr:MAG: hypothetical protein BGO63_10570 [Candidatus Accumulibacter sp. 66-26]